MAVRIYTGARAHVCVRMCVCGVCAWAQNINDIQLLIFL